MCSSSPEMAAPMSVTACPTKASSRASSIGLVSVVVTCPAPLFGRGSAADPQLKPASGAAWPASVPATDSRNPWRPPMSARLRVPEIGAELTRADVGPLEAGHVGLLGADGLGGGAQVGQLRVGQVALDDAADAGRADLGLDAQVDAGDAVLTVHP